MAKKKKYYPVVINGELIGIFKSWPECEPHVTGIKGKQLHYAGFKTLSDALSFVSTNFDGDIEELKAVLNKRRIPYEESDLPIPKTCPNEAMHVYISGMYDESHSCYAYAFCVVSDDEVVYEESAIGTKGVFLRHIMAEMIAAEKAVEYALFESKTDVVLYHDYAGIELWTLPTKMGGWRAKNAYTKQYRQRMLAYRTKINIHFSTAGSSEHRKRVKYLVKHTLNKTLP